MKFHTRKLIKPDNLNAKNTLFGGALLRWIDEEAAIYTMAKLNTQNVVTKYISEINFIASATQGDVIEIGMEIIGVGRTSISLKCLVRNLFTQKEIISIEKLVFVKVDDQGCAEPHGLTMDDLKAMKK